MTDRLLETLQKPARWDLPTVPPNARSVAALAFARFFWKKISRQEVAKSFFTRLLEKNMINEAWGVTLIGV